MESYKFSKFNLLYKIDGSMFVVNTYSGAILKVDNEFVEVFKSKSVDKLPQDIKEVLINNGILVPNSLDELKRIEFEYNLSRFHPKVFKATLTLTRDCNLACPYCYQLQRGLRERKYLTKTDANSLVLFFERMFNTYSLPISIFLTGGEPLVNFDTAMYIFDSLIQKEIPWKFDGIVTNGTLLDMETLRLIDEYGHKSNSLVRLQVTLDGYKQRHDKFRFFKDTREGTFDIIIDNLKNAKKFKHIHPFIRINISLGNFEVEEIRELLTLLKQEHLDEIGTIYFAFVNSKSIPIVSGKKNKYFITGKTVARVFRQLLDIAEDVGVNMMNLTQLVNRTGHFCMFDTPFSIAVDFDLSVYKCWELVGDKRFSVGTIDSNGILKPNPSYYTIHSRNPTQFKQCSNCKLLPICMGGCAREALKLHGTFFGSGCIELVYTYPIIIEYIVKKRISQNIQKS
ncbi:radical SAM/SPASM domain-containing protein [Thermococcus aciditolerans]|uniref:Radical SAM protein n=1 Tax=Thermococcus aciditolerans TaxID=2598455 RepID=A0A5C0SLN9_9EURY|nr:radical SAM protein [Thermococcus aciditolerans]QEK14902.1 radical SAM protein [Thermococcus aciditolerans]